MRKYGHALGFQGEPKLLDRTDCLLLLEDLLPQLELHHYLDLHEPILKLRSILGAIGRAKDELASPEDYRRCAKVMLDSATDDDAVEKAEKAIEVARAYEIYDAALRQRGSVDFGDLVALPIKILRDNPEIREGVRAEKRHVLVDEYQDMNRASALLLRELCVPRRGPWVVGDVRQSIYRFRGASPLNMTRFAEEFPGAQTTDLAVNYRSGGQIVRTFETFGRSMTIGSSTPASNLTAHRGEAHGVVHYDVATTREAEAHGIAQAILARVAAGVPFSSHAILARSHTVLSRLAAELEAEGVPCLYFGDFFERPEIRDLLSLLSLVSERKGVGLLRVAQFPGYAVPAADIQTLIAWRRQQDNVTMLSALKAHRDIPGITVAGHAGFERLASDTCDSQWTTSPHHFLISYLFRRSNYLVPLIADETISGQQQRLAIYQLLQFAFAFKVVPGSDPKRAFLSHVRRLEVLDEEKQLRQLPAAVSDINGVRLMTVHASKGLEFPIVHLAALTTRHFPAINRSDSCPLPEGLVTTDGLMSRDAEEDSLFFVAVSRAQDVIHLSRAQTNGKQTANASRFLGTIESHLPRPKDSPPLWKAAGKPPVEWPLLLGRSANHLWTAREIETYLDCPRRFYYEHALELGGADTIPPFLRFQSALHSSMAWLRKTPSPEDRRNGLTAQIAEDWQKYGPMDHALEPMYRRMAELMIDKALSVMDGENLVAERQFVMAPAGVTVTCRADQIQRTAGGIAIRRLKAGRLAKKEEDKARYVLLRAAIRVDHPHEDIQFEHVSLLTGERRVANGQAGKSKDSMAEIMDAIAAAGEGKFNPNPSARSCPTCPYFFVCPSHAATK